MIWRHGPSLPLEHRLPLLMGAQLALILVVSVELTSSVLTQSAEAAAHERIEHAVEHVAATAGPSLIEVHQRVAAAAAHPAVRGALERPGAAAQVTAAEAVLSALGPVGSMVLAVDGTAVVRTGSAADVTAGVPTADSVVSGPLFQHGRRTSAWISAPVSDAAGRIIGHVATVLRVGGPANAMQSLSELTGEVVNIHVRSEAGDLWARHPGIPMPPPRREQDATGRLSLVRTNGERTLAAEHRLGTTPWFVVLETPVKAVHARADRTVLLLSLASLLLLLVGAFVSWLLSRHIVRPLVSLTAAAEAIAHGDYSRRVDHEGSDEVGRLASSFNVMAAEVEAARTALIDRVQEAQEAREEAERANRAKADFLAVMSHELRTPLNAVGGYAQLMQMGIHGPLTERQRDALSRIDRNQAHLLTLINDVLSYAKLDAGMVTYVMTDVPVAALLADVEPVVAPQIQASGLELVVEPCDPEVTAHADHDKLQQIIINLIANAIKFTPQGGRITVSCDVSGDTLSIAVSDTGIGIHPDRLSAIFDPFFQADRALNRPGEGVGLGLAISRDLAHGMNGEVSVTSKLGAGSTFTVTLSCGAAAAVQHA